jgi:predicted nucleic acid-binding protein
VIALSRNDLRARATLTAAREAGVEMVIPSVVIAETVRGSTRDASVNRVIKAVGEVVVASEKTGRTAGALLGAARSASTVDALVIASAMEAGGGVVLTSDPGDLAPLADGHPEVVISPL